MTEEEIHKALEQAKNKAYRALKQARATMAPEDVKEALWECMKERAMEFGAKYGPRQRDDGSEWSPEWGPEKQLDEAIRLAEDGDVEIVECSKLAYYALEDVLRNQAWKEMKEE